MLVLARYLGTSSENYTTIYPPSSPINNIYEGHKTEKDLNDKHFSIIELRHQYECITI